MARTPSTMLELGTPAPRFNLPEPKTGRDITIDDFADARGLLVVFLSNHCPYVHRIREAFAVFAREYVARGIAVVGINANDATRYPDDSPDKMIDEVEQHGYDFPYLFDERQSVAKAYQAACTPDFFLFDGERKLYYRGQFDDARPGNDVPTTGHDLRAACDALLAGEPASEEQVPSLGCNIKWKPGNEPDYYG
ncbi:alkyl hydroperoxide reductase [Acidihalobacter yilgarnensis]|uniref:Alkyl hydroperoxide reductase n=1 Tax=Acidihalobacter yilgarnensis TaxID=2819280 RepID=A0A1D8IJQ4_9GAMM|nr:thioredoxin family protein [Acidihalobacter yilgarnensis]AOU96683.1 alkyl hydroperoxide reductase [Acidihalobacter yilgarnensis]